MARPGHGSDHRRGSGNEVTDWPTALATIGPIGVALVGAIRPVAIGIVRLARAAERIADRLEGADYVTLPERSPETTFERVRARWGVEARIARKVPTMP